MPCNNPHARLLDENRLITLSNHQMHEHGRHKCCQCAYNQGYEQGSQLMENIVLNINALGDSQASGDMSFYSLDFDNIDTVEIVNYVDFCSGSGLLGFLQKGIDKNLVDYFLPC